MKKITVCIMMMFILVISYTQTVYGEELVLDMSAIDSYLSGVAGGEMNFDTLVGYIRAGDFKACLEYIFRICSEDFNSALVYHNRIMYTIIAICLLSVILRTCAYEKFSNTYNRIFICSASLILINLYSELYETANKVIDNLAGFMNVSLPVYFGISASLTDKLPFAVYGVFAGLVVVFHRGTVCFVLPAITVSAILGISENICTYFDTSAIRKYINNVINWLLGLYTTFFVAVLKLSQIGAYGTDKLVMSGIRYTLSHSIPVVGGFLSEIAGAVITSTLILHNAVGLGCVFVIALIAVVPFLMIFTISCILKLISSSLSGIAHKGLCNVIMCFGDCMCELSVIMLCGCVTFIIGVGIQISFGR